MLAIGLPKAIKERLEKLARETGRTRTFYARKAFLAYLDDLEDIYQADKAMMNLRKNHDEVYSIEDVEKE